MGGAAAGSGCGRIAKGLGEVVMNRLTWSSCALAAAAAISACDVAAERTAEIQVVGSAVVERPAELFRVNVQVVERAADSVTALAAASSKLDQITSQIAELDGLTSYSIVSDQASAVIARPLGCELGDASYYGDPIARPEDCSVLETGAILDFTLEGTPAEAAGMAISFLAQSGVEFVELSGFDVEDRAAAELEVKQAALADAMSTAEALAAQADVVISRPSSIRYGDAGRFNRDISVEGERIVVTGSRITRQADVRLDLSPPPVPFEAEVAVIFTIEDGSAGP